VPVLVLLGIGFLAGVITAVSPCILPVLPIVLAGGASSTGRRRPFAIIAGLVASFTVFTLVAASLLSAFGLPQDLLRNLAIATLFVLAASLLVPQVAYWLERPLAFMTRRRGGNLGGGFVLGVSLGLVFVPCAGPVLAAITTLSAQHRIGFDTVLLTLAYALGAAGPMLLIALGGQRVARRMRAQSRNFQRAMGVLLAGAALALVFNVSQSLQTALGGYTTSIQKHVEETSLAQKHLDALRGGGNAFAAAAAKATKTKAARSSLPALGAAPDFTGISDWLNTPGDRAESLASLRGKVVLVDFWTYSCINCLRTLPHLRAWYATYHKAGLDIVGVHTPEFAFEHVLGNVRAATHDLHVTWPVALDNGYATWTAYSNQYWPAEYLIDKTGQVRHVQFGEGDYDGTEQAIRSLLAEAGASSLPQRMTGVADATPKELALTPESYLGTARLARYVGSPIKPNVAADYTFAKTIPQDDLSYAGVWNVGAQRIIAGMGAQLRLHYQARYVYVVLGGRGTAQTLIDGKPSKTLDVSADKLYTAVSQTSATNGLLELRMSPGVNAYAFTFG
jgi:cytochrome c biogenesis protein CcdA/thiol-disulfide isomerase/thioredoxin